MIITKEVMVTVGGSEAIDIALRAMLNPGDEVLIPQPSYVSYTPCTVLADGVPVTIQLEEKDKFRLTKEKLLEKITPKTKGSDPSVPEQPDRFHYGGGRSGRDRESLRGEKTCLLSPMRSTPSLLTRDSTVRLLHSGNEGAYRSDQRLLKKSFAMTGWRLGYACAPELILKQMLKRSTSLRSCVHRQQASMLRSRH